MFGGAGGVAFTLSIQSYDADSGAQTQLLLI